MDSLGEVGKKMRVSFQPGGRGVVFTIAILSRFQSIFRFSPQSAIKAKLVELGSGSNTNYIDDELPDYVMIMVANKRSESSMTQDLKLFLGSNTEVFGKFSTSSAVLLAQPTTILFLVSWLHQVLKKLQEVTLPNNCKSSPF